jgi:hypothetical protein
MNNYTIKSIIRKIYSIDYSNIKLENNTELIISKKMNDFHQLLYMQNELANTYLIPYFDDENKSVQTGLFYKDKSIYNHPIHGNPLISFKLSLTGIKKNTFYRMRFLCETLDTKAEITSSKLYIVLNGKDIIYNKELCGNESNIEHIFLSEGSVLNVAVTIGKIKIKDIIFEEVDVAEAAIIKENTIEIPDLINLKAYAVFKPSMLVPGDKVISKFPLLRGIGLNVMYDREKDIILIERNKENDVIQENIGLCKYLIDVKCINAGVISEHFVGEGASPFSGYDGYSTFKLRDNKNDTKIYILVYELL